MPLLWQKNGTKTQPRKIRSNYRLDNSSRARLFVCPCRHGLIREEPRRGSGAVNRQGCRSRARGRDYSPEGADKKCAAIHNPRGAPPPMSPGLRQGLVAKSASTVWLLDDDPSVLKATGRLLASAGWEVERFIDPDAFLRRAEIHHPRVVVIDMWMPRMNGLEVQRRLSGISPSTRVIVLTANDDRIVRWKALAAGAAAFFIKPECGDEFLAGVRSAFAAN